jgi:hypothetical protein
MAYWQLGDNEQARKAYNQGVQWLEDNKERVDHRLKREVNGFRDEAAALMGLTISVQKEKD